MAKKDPTDLTVEEKLKALYQLQVTLSGIDENRELRGELPLEVQDLEDEIAGLNTRIEKIQHEIEQHRLHLYFVSYEHIVRPQYQGSVEKHVGIRVESVHFQNGGVTTKLMFVHHERCAIHPVFVLHPLHDFLVHAVERIRYSVMVQQVLVHGSGHLGVAPKRVAHLAEGPVGM